MLNFTKIYVIQSLDPNEEDLTGTQLYEEVLQYFSAKHSWINADLIDVNTSNELFAALESIENECVKDDVKPLIHFEIHGLEDRTGLSLNNDDVSWNEIYELLIRINEASGWSLYITMAVCYGNYAMLLINPTHPAPFAGVLGSFDELQTSDLYIRYNSFYQELLNSLDFDKALEALHKSNSTIPADYRFIGAEQTFKNVYQKYLDSQFSPDKIQIRFKTAIQEEGVIFSDEDDREQCFEAFKEAMENKKEEFYEKHKATFFMFNKFQSHQYVYCNNWEPNYNRL